MLIVNGSYFEDLMSHPANRHVSQKQSPLSVSFHTRLLRPPPLPHPLPPKEPEFYLHKTHIS